MRRARIFLWLVTITSILIGVASSGIAASPMQSDIKIHPLLRRLAAERPDQLIQVIIQMNRGHLLTPADMAPGTTSVGDLDFVNAHVVQLPAQAVSRMAKLASVRFISYDAPMLATEMYQPVTAFPYVTKINEAMWPDGYAGHGIGVAVIDTGVSNHPDLTDHLTQVDVGAGLIDTNGHGTHVAGIIAGRSSDGRYVGMAPRAHIYGLRVLGQDGSIRESDLIASLEWVFHHHQVHNIRVVNISLQSSIAQSYRTSAISAAVEQLWMNGIVVVVSSGNRGAVTDALHFPPSNDPYVITVGALSDNGTPDRTDDYVPTWSSRGMTQDGFLKPEVLAPGHLIAAPLAKDSYIASRGSASIIEETYIRLSGTSMAAPVVAGLAASLLSYNPALTPDQVKFLLTTKTYGATLNAVDAALIWQAVRGQPTSLISSANVGLIPNDYLSNAASSGSSVFSDTALIENVLFENVLFENVLFEN